MKIEDLTEEHLRAIEFREIERADLGDTLSKGLMNYYLNSDYKKAVTDDGQVVMAMGGKVNGESCRVWILASDLINKNPVASLEIITELEKEACQELKPNILFTYNLPEFPFAIKFLKRIGYKEARMEGGFGDGKERLLLFKEVGPWEAQ